jgi:putative oxidoreductase
MKSFPFLSSVTYLFILRLAVSLMLMAHGVIRIYAGTVEGFGGFLETKGFPLAVVIAWGVTIFEIVGGLSLALNYFRKPICALFIVQLIMGMVLVHWPNGWFVVGYTAGGIEYSFLLVVCFLVVAAGKE